jgi:outer membrane receptor protein involved in Fe transport
MVALGGGYVAGYTTVDLRAEWNQLMGSRIDGAINVINLTDKLYFVGNSGVLPFGIQSNGYAPPRMITAELSTKF